ncbi:MAG: hypothetical protein ACRD01_06600 [Terriglobales bacterium]
MPLTAWLEAARDGALTVLLLGAVISGAQWLLARIYGERLTGRPL